MDSTFRNISYATAASLSALIERGADATVHGDTQTKELLHRLTILERPTERFLFLPGRQNDLFAQIAEALWVLAGRNDLDWLERYLVRAKDFSDDGGRTWRAGYGPRLRNWAGTVDQVAEVRRLLLRDPSTRRAVISLFDPSTDFGESKDCPCNNWLSWIIRAGRLHMSVAIRSNDILWGFSGANAFEWSVLHEMMAYWTGAEVGSATYFATSLHLYERHYERAQAIATRFHGLSPYNFGVLRSPFATSWDEMKETLEDWFKLEERIRADPDAPILKGPSLRDPFMRACLQIIRLKWGSVGWDDAKLASEFSLLPESDMLAAAYEYFGRRRVALLETIPHPKIAAYFEACRQPNEILGPRFTEAVSRLHARKDRAYGTAWKKRGEQISILPNIARKVDRLEVFNRCHEEIKGETLLDTAVDLYVYVSKYRLFLEDEGINEDEQSSCLLPANAPQPYSDHVFNFDVLIRGTDFRRNEGILREQIEKVVTTFENLWPRTKDAPLAERRQMASDLGEGAQALVAAVIQEHPQLAASFLQTEEAFSKKSAKPGEPI